ncbi:MAG TPA: hypothetical protein VJT82_05530 [Pyrinomonadaceae bacterium]|nr:hypothetical protein [Pyrinomonadaceae bacterium]
MKPRGSIVIALSSLLLSPALAAAQTPAAPSQVAKPRAKSVREVDPLAEARRATAITLVTSLADEARGFHDETLRARVQARAADALWETDAEKARALFRRAWDSAEISDRESLRRYEEDRQAQMRNNGAVMLRTPPSLRGEVLRLAARRDRTLGEEFLAKLDDARKQERADAALKTDAPAPRSLNPGDPSNIDNAIKQRLDLASQLLDGGDVERARQFAEPALRRVTIDALKFLVSLRKQDAASADKLYAALLAGAANDPATDANTVSLLSSYIFTPGLFIEVERGGGWNVNNSDGLSAPTDFAAQLRSAFFQFAAQVLVRPMPPPDQDRSSAGRTGTYFVIARLLPLFEQFAPAAVPALRAQLTALTPDAPEDYRSNHPLLTKGLVPEESAPDAVQRALDRLAQAKTPAERDAVYVEAAFAADSKRDPRAREFADKIDDSETRRQMRAYLDFSDLSDALTKKDVDEILRLAKSSDITSIQRVWAYTEAARLLVKTDRTRAVEVLEDATAETRRIDGEHADRARAIVAIATLMYELDRARVWSLLPEATKIINSVSDFNGEDGSVGVQFRTRSMGAFRSSSAPNFNLQTLVALLARENMDRAVEFARGLNAEAPRAVATLAIATTILKNKKP